ncbi:hypothetical protein BOX15_Mlig021449g2 [Macrostomum lignano]|uniref:Uncharacterized protein n=1 Tax=Macrostomum lignano TaxID=282301 RepID=A0A267DHV3_9PLAT|nr:hypothetical protein BOX15_Mlig021449g2 [Macrostomum lignano]
MWQGSMEQLLMPGWRGEVPHRGSRVRRHQSHTKAASSVTRRSRSISRRLRERQLLSLCLLQRGDAQRHPPLPRHRHRRRGLSQSEDNRGIEICVELLVARQRPQSRRHFSLCLQLPLTDRAGTAATSTASLRLSQAGGPESEELPAFHETRPENRAPRDCLLALCLAKAEWPSCAAEHSRLPRQGQARCRQGQRPVIGCAILDANLASWFATQHRPPVQSLLCHQRPPQPPLHCCLALQLPAAPQLPQVAEAAALQLRREAVKLCSCGLHQLTDLPGSVKKRCASHRLLLRPTASARVIAPRRFAAESPAVASRLGPTAPFHAAIDKLQISQGLGAVAAAGRHLCYACCSCLRLLLQPVAELRARRLRSLQSDGRQGSGLTIASASIETIGFGKLVIGCRSPLSEKAEKQGSVDSAATRFAGNFGGDVGGFDGSKTASGFVAGGPQQQGDSSNRMDRGGADSHLAGARRVASPDEPPHLVGSEPGVRVTIQSLVVRRGAAAGPGTLPAAPSSCSVLSSHRTQRLCACEPGRPRPSRLPAAGLTAPRPHYRPRPAALLAADAAAAGFSDRRRRQHRSSSCRLASR